MLVSSNRPQFVFVSSLVQGVVCLLRKTCLKDYNSACISGSFDFFYAGKVNVFCKNCPDLLIWRSASDSVIYIISCSTSGFPFILLANR